jgi:hypothetical protein
LEDFAKVVNVNLIGTYNAARVFAAACAKLDPMEDGERGAMVFTASVAAFDGQVGQQAYSASKAGVAGMTLPMARDLQRPVSSILDLFISLLIAIALAMLLLWVLPSRRVAWQPLFPGALLIGSTLTILNLVIGRILLAVGVRFQAYGLVGGVLLLSLWVWLVGVILYYGQCLCVVLERRQRVRMDASPPIEIS